MGRLFLNEFLGCVCVCILSLLIFFSSILPISDEILKKNPLLLLLSVWTFVGIQICIKFVSQSWERHIWMFFFFGSVFHGTSSISVFDC